MPSRSLRSPEGAGKQAGRGARVRVRERAWAGGGLEQAERMGEVERAEKEGANERETYTHSLSL
jgi:hypothetical protein